MRSSSATAGGHLALRVLIWSLTVADRAAEPGNSKAPGVDDSAVDVHAPERPGPLPSKGAEEEGSGEVLRAQGRRLGSEVRIVITGDEQQGNVEHRHEILEIVEGQIAAGHYEIGMESPDPLVVESLVDLIGDGQDPHQKALTVLFGALTGKPMMGFGALTGKPYDGRLGLPSTPAPLPHLQRRSLFSVLARMFLA